MEACEPRIQINILPVNSGDCIHLRFQSVNTWHNVIVDSGPAGTAGIFRALLNQIQSHGEHVDLLCFSHIDDDHIKGAERVFTSIGFDPSIIQRIWLNVPDDAIPVKDLNGIFSPKTVSAANKLLQAIVNHNISFDAKVMAGQEYLIGDAIIRVVLPTQERLDAYYAEWRKHIQTPLYQPQAAHSDTSPTNGSSIALLCKIGERQLLLTGDAFPGDLAAVGDQYAGEQGFSIIKLPHHGSDANISEQMLKSLKSQDFIISTKQTPQRPGQEAMGLISAYGSCTDGVTLYGNYEWSRYSSGIPNVTVVYPQNQGVLSRERIEVYSDARSTQIYAEPACCPDSTE